MPIRFRCAYCNQLMGISRRKAGEVVRCPTCTGQVVVPKPEVDDGEKESVNPPPGKGALFEHSDFDKELFDSRPSIQPGSARAGGFAPARAGPAPAAPVPSHSVPGPAPPAAAQGPGILLTPGKATVLAVLFVLLLGVAFFAGMLVGRS